MCKYMYCRARNHRVNFSTILDKAMAMVEAFDRHGHMKNDIGPLPYHGGMAESITHEYGLFIQVPPPLHTNCYTPHRRSSFVPACLICLSSLLCVCCV